MEVCRNIATDYGEPEKRISIPARRGERTVQYLGDVMSLLL
jgi:hypothetical protein